MADSIGQLPPSHSLPLIEQDSPAQDLPASVDTVSAAPVSAKDGDTNKANASNEVICRVMFDLLGH
jgi:hypothetical protein